MRIGQRIAIVIVISALALPLSLMAQERARLDTTVRLNLRGTVDLSLVAGKITVRGWQRANVRVVASTQNGSLRFDATPNRVTLRVEREREGASSPGPASYDVSVPRGTRLRLRAGSGNVTVSGSQGEISATSVGGAINVTDARRQVALESVSGLIIASQISGDLRAQNVSGGIRAENVSGRLEAWAVNGGIRLIGGRSNDIRAETVGGDILYAGPAATGGTYDFESHSGTIRVTIPRSPGAKVRVETVRGTVQTDSRIITAPAGGARRGRRVAFTIGDGLANVSARTFSGRISIRTGAAATTPGVFGSIVRSDSVSGIRRGDLTPTIWRNLLPPIRKDSVRTIRR
jgi:hypothetical protein